MAKDVKSVEEVKKDEPKETLAERLIRLCFPGTTTKETLKIWGKRLLKVAGVAAVGAAGYALGAAQNSETEEETETNSEEE